MLIHILFGFLALLGIVWLIRSFSLGFCTVESDGCYWLLVLNGPDSDLRLKSAVNRMQWDSHAAAGILAVDGGMGEQTRRACEIVAGEAGVRLLSKKEFEEWLGGQIRERDDRTERDGG